MVAGPSSGRRPGQPQGALASGRPRREAPAARRPPRPRPACGTALTAVTARPPVPWHARLVVWGFHLSAIGLALRSAFGHVAWARHTGRLLFDITSMVFIVAGAFALAVVRQDRRAAPALTPVTGFLAACGLAAAAGIAHGNRPLDWLLIGLFPFGTAAAAALGATPGMFPPLFRAVLTQTYLGAGFATWVLLFARPAGRQEWWGPHGENPASMAAQSLYGLSFVTPYLHALPRRHALGVAYALCAFVALHLVGVNRTPLLTFGIVLPLLLAAALWRRHRRIAPLGRTLRAVGTVAALAAATALLVVPASAGLMVFLDARLEENAGRLLGGGMHEAFSIQGLLHGLMESSAVEFFGPSNRGGELREFLGQLQPIDLLCGRGFGGTWLSLFWGRRWPMVHIGPAHLVLVGGLPFVAAFYWLTGRALWSAWQALPRALPALGVVAYLVDFSLAFLQHGMLRENHTVFLFWLCCGIALGLGRRAPLGA